MSATTYAETSLICCAVSVPLNGGHAAAAVRHLREDDAELLRGRDRGQVGAAVAAGAASRRGRSSSCRRRRSCRRPRSPPSRSAAAGLAGVARRPGRRRAPAPGRACRRARRATGCRRAARRRARCRPRRRRRTHGRSARKIVGASFAPAPVWKLHSCLPVARVVGLKLAVVAADEDEVARRSSSSRRSTTPATASARRSSRSSRRWRVNVPDVLAEAAADRERAADRDLARRPCPAESRSSRACSPVVPLCAQT